MTTKQNSTTPRRPACEPPPLNNEPWRKSSPPPYEKKKKITTTKKWKFRSEVVEDSRPSPPPSFKEKTFLMGAFAICPLGMGAGDGKKGPQMRKNVEELPSTS
ncbi:hypothetical protein CEXT_387281 [Caerostris extrusa]|uniref:Uncharacterized protein n=1 Tax=Caerostris extrusa TaxID=172846 RepID=A0AAV4RDN6_CAEEX|nr:hypothetical protein CEXT_387281 [Caerostris extrusa]